ncbi:hypothetical protein, partial [Flavobacterium sp.]|uniref:hypothetical protein n=1 Tax=Flavobacterium sp. TaxID=239 RepID=UPI002ED8D40D
MDIYEYSSDLKIMSDKLNGINLKYLLRQDSLGKESLARYESVLQQFNDNLVQIILNLDSFSSGTISEVHHFYHDLIEFYSEIFNL